MIYNDFQELKLSLLGFGTMRLPLIPGGSGADIDQAQVDKMVDYAIANGVNYFDTAFPYHESQSEIAIGNSLARYLRDKFYLATKFPGHQISDSYNPAEIFEEQLKKCKVDYSYAPAFANRQRAAVIATLGEIYFGEGKVETATSHAPEYLRLSQAERERMEQSTGVNS